MGLRRRSSLGLQSPTRCTPRRTAQALHRRAIKQSINKITKNVAGSTCNTPAGAVQFGAASKANLKVVVRVRPHNEREVRDNAR